MIVVIGVLGTRGPSREVAAVVSPSAVAAVVEPSAGVAAEPVLRVESPSGPGAVITTPRLMVRGSLAGEVGALRVTLESSGGKLVASETLPPARAEMPFQVDFPISNPRPGGTMVVQVVAFTDHGIPVEVVRIPVEIGALLEGAPRNVGRTGQGPLGEDGILGGIVFGNAWDPDALGEPATP